MKKKTVEYGKYGYFFILPFFLVFFVFQLYPLIYTFYLSFVEYYQIKLGKFQGPNFNGLKNYIMVLATTEGKGSDLKVVSWFDTMTVKSIGNTLKIWVLNFIAFGFLVYRYGCKVKRTGRVQDYDVHAEHYHCIFHRRFVL